MKQRHYFIEAENGGEVNDLTAQHVKNPYTIYLSLTETAAGSAGPAVAITSVKLAVGFRELGLSTPSYHRTQQ